MSQDRINAGHYAWPRHHDWLERDFISVCSPPLYKYSLKDAGNATPQKTVSLDIN